MRVLAVDLGATSIRVAAIDLDAPEPEPLILHRWPHGPVEQPDGSLRWDWARIVTEVERGLGAGIEAGPVTSIGVDGWAVDYGLLDADGTLLSAPFSYRDRRTEPWRATLGEIGAAELYAATGAQQQPFCTLFQLAAHDPGELARATRLLLLPDLLVHLLTSRDGAPWVGAERSNASTTALLDARTGSWSPRLAAAAGIDPELLPPVADAGTRAGTWRGVPVHLVGSHDTASAFVAVPGVPTTGTAIVSSGTWVLVGTERPEPVTTEAARSSNFANERGALGGVRLLKNVMGFWMLEQCRAQWGAPAVEKLIDAATAVDGVVPTVDATDERFLSPPDMEAEIRDAARLSASATRAEVTRCILESIAAATADVIDEIGEVTGTPVDDVLVVGGGSRLAFMNELFARHTGRPVTVGLAEATAVGNAMVQGITLGRFTDLDDARRWTAGAAHRLGAATGPEAAPRPGRTAGG